MDYVNKMRELPKKHDFFIGFDSDGCVFDTMEIKHKECFCPAFIKHFNLQAVSKYAREVWEFVNLYSKSRGSNRFLAVKEALERIEKRPKCRERHIGDLTHHSLNQWLQEENKLGNPALQRKIDSSGDAELQEVLAWSEEVNERVSDMVSGIPPFPGVEDVLQCASGRADMIVVSQTPLEALEREWKEHGIDGCMELFCGQEFGTKTEHLKYCGGEKYDPDKVLMVGDAPGDLKAAKNNATLFFPIVCGAEEASWKQFAEEALERFFAGTFRGSYQDELLQAFEKALPEKPPWQG